MDFTYLFATTKSYFIIVDWLICYLYIINVYTICQTISAFKTYITSSNCLYMFICRNAQKKCKTVVHECL